MPVKNWSYAAAASGIVNTTTAVTIKAAETANVSGGTVYKNQVRSLQVAHATLGAATELAIRDGAGGTVLWRMTLGTVANENIGVWFDPPLQGSSALLEVVTLTAVTGGVHVNAQGYVN